MVRAILKAEARMRYADGKQAIRSLEASLPKSPTWISNKTTVEALLNEVMKTSVRRGIPAAYVNAVLMQDEFAVMMMNLVGDCERSGGSFPEQQRTGADFIRAAWERMPDEGKADVFKFQELGSSFVEKARADRLTD